MGGVATFTDLADDTAGTITLTFSERQPGNGHVQYHRHQPGRGQPVGRDPAALSTATAGQALRTQPVVEEEDQYGNVITGDSTNTVTAARGSLGTSSLQGSNLTVTLVNGVATFSGLSYDKAESMNIAFTTNASGVSSATSDDITVSPTTASQLIINQQPSATATAGQPFPTQPVVYEEDQFGNIETGDNSTSGHGDVRAAASARSRGRPPATVSGGVARFSNLADNTAETISLEFTSGISALTRFELDRRQPGRGHQAGDRTPSPRPPPRPGRRSPSSRCIYVEDPNGNIETSDNSTAGERVARQRRRPARGTTIGDRPGRRRDVHRPLRDHGRDDLAGVLRRDGLTRRTFQQYRRQPGGPASW